MMMRFAVAALTVLLCVLPVGTVAGAADDGSVVPEQLQDKILCGFLHAAPYWANVPEGVTCDYEPRPLTLEEARMYYQSVSDEANRVTYGWNCADTKAKKGLTWKQHRKWKDRSLAASAHSRDRLASVIWPADVAAEIEALRSRSLKVDRALDAVHSRRSFDRAVASGDLKRLQQLNKKQAATVVKIRSALELPDPAPVEDACRKVREYERKQDQG